MADGPAKLVSIVVPAYNAAGWVGRAIDSLLAQTYQPVEVIVVNDGSTDATGEVCRAYGAAVTLLEQAHAGVSAARNAGIGLARGEFVGFLDADDEALPGMVGTLAEALERFDQAAAASGACWRIRPGRPARRVPAPGQVLGGSAEAGLVADFFALYARMPLVLTGSVLVRRRAFEELGGFRTDLWRGEDREMWCRIAGRFAWAYVDRAVVRYHDSPATSISRTLTWPSDVRLVDELYAEPQMQRLVRQELWDSYRRYRRDMVLKGCQFHAARLTAAQMRALLAVIPPADDSIRWRMLRWLARLPAPILRAIGPCLKAADRL